MQKTVKMTFSVIDPNSSESGIPTGHRKLEKLSELLGSYRKVIQKLSASFRQLWHRFTFTTNSNGNYRAFNR